MEIIALILPTTANAADDSSRRGRDGEESRPSTDIFSVLLFPTGLQQCVFDGCGLISVSVSVKGAFTV